jgi:2-polyprenyl-3-methyl-5-hydroxy-6-metoxy-1,4-benzoquinol methylase
MVRRTVEWPIGVMIRSQAMTERVNMAARRYLGAWRRLVRLPPRPRAALQALCLGLMDTEALSAVTRLSYSSGTGFDSEEHNRSGLWPSEEEVVRTHFAGCRSILVAGAGGGREAIALARLGHAVTAFDFCKALTDACRMHCVRAGLRVRVCDAPADDLPEGLGLYDGVFAGRGFYHHILGRQRRIAFLRRCRDHLGAGGPLFLSDFFTRPTASRAHRNIRLVANAVRRLRFSRETVELGDWLTDCAQHAFVQAEIESELQEGGFEPVLYAASPMGDSCRLAHAVGIALPKGPGESRDLQSAADPRQTHHAAAELPRSF